MLKIHLGTSVSILFAIIFCSATTQATYVDVPNPNNALNVDQSFAIDSGKSMTVELSDAIKQYDSLICEIRFDKANFNEKWGPGISIVLRGGKGKKDALQLSMTETHTDYQWLFTYSLNEESRKGIFARPITVMAIPRTKEPIKLILTKYGNLVYYRVYITDYAFSEGYIPYDASHLNTGLLTLSSAEGRYNCDIYEPELPLDSATSK